MQDTDLLFYKTPYEKVIDGEIKKIEVDESGDLYALLDRTIFYPQGGGQLGDRGTFVVNIHTELDEQVFEVVKTVRRDNGIRHYLKSNIYKIDLLKGVKNLKFVGGLNWPLRYHQMKLHSAVHLIHCMLEEVTYKSIPYPIRSPLSDTIGENEYDFSDEFSQEDLTKATALLNKFTSNGYAIKSESVQGNANGFRVWKCEQWTIPCGGVHILNTSELGLVESTMKIKNGKVRVSVRLVEKTILNYVNDS